MPGSRCASHGWAGVFTTLALLVLTGCGDSLKTYPVSGKVVLTDGDVSQLAGSYVELAQSNDADLRASGTIESDGTFWLQTQHKGQLYKGAPEGTYQARIIPGGESDQARRRSAIHARFLDFKKSGLTVQVPTTGDVTLTLSKR